MNLIARLGVLLGLDNKDFIKGIDQATGKTREFEINTKRELKLAEKNFAAFQAAASKSMLGVVAAVAAVGSAFKYADEIEKTAKAYDVSVESLLALQKAFKLSGGESEMAGDALQKLAVAQQNAIDGSDALRDAFSKLGISGKDVEQLSLEDLFKRVAQELSKVENTTQRAALQQELLGKAVKGTNWKELASNYKEVADPSLAQAIEENAKAWGNIEKIFQDMLNNIQKMVEPLAKVFNYIADIGNEYDRIKRGGGAEIDFGAALGGMPGEAIVGQYYDVPASTKPIAKDAQSGKYSAQTEKEKAAAKKAADEARRKAEARAQLETEIKLLEQQAKIANDMFAIDSKGITLGNAAISQEKMMLDLANDIATIRANATKERSKDKAQIDLINKKEAAEIDARVAKFGYANGLRMQAAEREHQLKIKAIRDEADAMHEAQTVAAWNELNLLDVEKERYKLGSDAYELKKLEVQEGNKLREIYLANAEELKKINNEYELSAKTAKDLEIYEEKIAALHGKTRREIDYTLSAESNKREILKEQLDIQNKLFNIDLQSKTEREVSNIRSTLGIEKERHDLEMSRYKMSTNQFNVMTLLLNNAQALVAVEKKYNDEKTEAYYQMQMAGETPKAREQYEARIKAIDRVKEIELDAIRQVGIMKDEELQRDINRQQSWVAGWDDAARQYRESIDKSFNRGAAAFASVMSNMDASISNFVETGKFKFQDFAASVIKDIIRMEMQAQAASLFRMFLGSIGSTTTLNLGGGASAPYGGYTNVGVGFQTRATGGDINGPAIVGENGPELFIPSQRGTIIPNTIAPSMAGMGQPQMVINGPYIENMSAIDTQSGQQFLAKNKNTIWAAYQSANRTVPLSR